MRNFPPAKAVIATSLFVAATQLLSAATDPKSQLNSVEVDGKHGYINRSGEIVLPPVYFRASPFRDGFAIVDTGPGEQLIDRTGRLVPLPTGVYPSISVNRFTLVFDQDYKWGMAGPDGKLFVPCIYDAIRPFFEGYATFRLNDKAGFIRQSDGRVVQTDFDSINSFENGIAETYQDQLWGAIDANGDVVLPFEHKHIRGFSGDLAAVSKDRKTWRFIGTNGLPAFVGVYYDPTFTSKGLIGVQFEAGGQYGFLSRDGEVVLQAQFSDIGSYRDELCSVVAGRKTTPLGEGVTIIDNQGISGFIDESGAWAIRFTNSGPNAIEFKEFAHQYRFHNGLVEIRGDYYDKKGQRVWKHEQSSHKATINARYEKLLFANIQGVRLHGLVGLRKDDEARELLSREPALIRWSSAEIDTDPLIETAIRHGSTKMIYWLISQGAPLNVKCSSNMSVLETAVVARKEEKTAVVRRLLEAGANPNLRFPSTGGFSNDDSALHHAAASENFTDLEIARLLLDHDALPNARDDEGNTPLHNLFDCLGKINYPMVELLLNRGADPNAANNEGETPLFHGDVFDEFEHWPEVLQLLSRHKANFNHVSKDGDTPLHHAVRLWANVDRIKPLLAVGADPTIKNAEGDTPLSEALGELNRLKKRKTAAADRIREQAAVVKLLQDFLGAR